MKLLRVSGRIDPLGRFVPALGWETSHVASVLSLEGRYRIELLDDQGNLLLRAHAAETLNDTGPRNQLRVPEVVGYVPFDPRATRLRVVDSSTDDDTALYEATIATAPPKVEVAKVTMTGTRLAATWASDHDRAVFYNVALFVTRGRSFTLGLGLTTSTLEVDVGHLPGGEECHVVVVATDGTRSSTAISAPFRLEGAPVRATIASPRDGARFGPYEPVSLVGSVHDAGGEPLDDEGLRWQVDGEPTGSGERIVGVAGLTPGAHGVELTHVSGGTPALVTIYVEAATEDSWRGVRMPTRLPGTGRTTRPSR